ncbi:MAG: hypothetical protein VB065_04660, partial [Eubacteriales bacterium]|nr:hypothetical protein [Eubacteriales bacterium]
SISVQGRNTQGVRLMRVGDGARVVCVARAEPEDDEDDEDEADANGEVDAADGAGAADEANDQVPDALGRLVRDLEENPEP